MPSLTDPKPFDCPSCGASLPPPPLGATSLICSFCNKTVIISAEQNAAREAGAFKKQTLNELMQLVAASQKIEAIRLYRERFPWIGLKQAKEAIETLEMGRSLELPDPVRPAEPAPAPSETPAPSPIRISIASTSSSPRRSSGAGCATVGSIIVSIMVLAGGLVFALQAANGLPFNIPGLPTLPAISLRSAPLLMEPMVLVPTEAEAPDVVGVMYRYDTDPSTYALARISGTTGQVVWEGEPFPEDVYRPDALLVADERVYAVKDEIVTVYDVSDGSVVRHHRLSDKIASGTCDQVPCLMAQAGVLLVISADDMLQAYDIQKGEALWERRLDQYEYQAGIRQAGGRLLIRESNPSDYTYSFVLLDWKTGEETGRFTPQTNSRPDFVFVAPDGQSLYLLAGDWCEKWQLNATGAEPVWQVDLAESSSWTQPALLTDRAVYDFVSQSDGYHLRAIDVVSGSEQLLAGYADYSLQPLALVDDHLLTLARRTRGSTRYELWGLAADSGERAWDINLDESQPLDEFAGSISNDESAWLWHIFSDRLYIVQFKADPNDVVVGAYRLSDGNKTDSETLALSLGDAEYYSPPSILGWQGHSLWFNVGSKIGILDVDKSELSLIGPG